MPRIVVLEENKSLGEALKDALVGMGHTVDCAQSVPGCLTLLNDNECDLLITDFFMTSKGVATPTSGATVIIAVRYGNATANGLDVDPALPIIAMSGCVPNAAAADPLELCAALGATGTIRKPLQVGDLKRAVDEALCAA